jgi:hypothetical protein
VVVLTHDRCSLAWSMLWRCDICVYDAWLGHGGGGGILITPKSRDHCSTSQCGSRVSIRKSKKEKLIFSTTELSQVLVDYALENLIEWWRLI